MGRKTIGVMEKTYEKLLMKKLEMSQKEKRNITWDEFFERTIFSR
jgi:hypothetical protein